MYSYIFKVDDELMEKHLNHWTNYIVSLSSSSTPAHHVHVGAIHVRISL